MFENIILCFDKNEEMIGYTDNQESAERICKRHEEDWKTSDCFSKKFDEVINTNQKLSDIMYDFFDIFYLNGSQLENIYVTRRGYVVADLRGDDSKVHACMDNVMKFIFKYDNYKTSYFGDMTTDFYSARHFFKPTK